MTTPIVSVIVATLDRADYLDRCLRALAQQSTAPHSVEVLVIDNGSTDRTAEIARRYCDQHPGFRYLSEPQKGLAIARNTGLAAASADIVAFTDDDAIPDPDWVERIWERFEQLPASVAVLGGEVRPLWEGPRPDWLKDPLLRPLSAGLHWGPTARLLHRDEWLVEVNIAYRKQHLLAAGGFPTQLGRVGTNLLSGEGCVNVLLERAGLGAFYDPAILVSHHIPVTRLTQAWFRRRAFWQGVSMRRVNEYIEDASRRMGLVNDEPTPAVWEEIRLPANAAAWAELFADASAEALPDRLHAIEQLGHLLEAQALMSGR